VRRVQRETADEDLGQRRIHVHCARGGYRDAVRAEEFHGGLRFYDRWFSYAEWRVPATPSIRANWDARRWVNPAK
jgi:hypothetical protein